MDGKLAFHFQQCTEKSMNIEAREKTRFYAFFTKIVALSVFTVLTPEWSSFYVRKIFPKYDTFLGVLCVAASFLTSIHYVSYSEFM